MPKSSPTGILLLLWLVCHSAQAFVVGGRSSCYVRPVSPLKESKQQQDDEGESSSSPSAAKPKNLLDKKVFLEAIQALKGQQDISLKTDDPQLAESEPDFMIGRLVCTLDITGNPGIDLAETPNGLVVIRSVAGNALEGGVIQVGDSIVSVSAGPNQEYHKDCPQAKLEEMAMILQGGAQQALVLKEKEITLELNRLIEIRYLDEQPKDGEDSGDKSE